MDADNKYGSGFYKCLSNDLKEELPGVDGLSPSNIRYTKRFYLLYNELAENLFSVPWPRHGQGEGPARYELRDSGTK